MPYLSHNIRVASHAFRSVIHDLENLLETASADVVRCTWPGSTFPLICPIIARASAHTHTHTRTPELQAVIPPQLLVLSTDSTYTHARARKDPHNKLKDRRAARRRREIMRAYVVRCRASRFRVQDCTPQPPPAPPGTAGRSAAAP